MNLASIQYGANIVNASSELVGCEAIHLLNDDMSQIWLSDDDIPQWLCISLQYCTLLTPQTAYQTALEIRTIGWYCWHPYLTNPKEVRLHVSRDSIKFKIWDTFITSERKEGIQLFCCEPINIELYPYIALEIVSTFGGNQTYMNRLYLYTDEITYASTSFTQTSASSSSSTSELSSTSSLLSSNSQSRENGNLMDQRADIIEIDEAMVSLTTTDRRAPLKTNLNQQQTNNNKAVRMSEILEIKDEEDDLMKHERDEELTLQNHNLSTIAIDGREHRIRKSRRLATSITNNTIITSNGHDALSDGEFSDDSLSTVPSSKSTGSHSMGRIDRSDKSDRNHDETATDRNNQRVHDLDLVFYNNHGSTDNHSIDSPIIPRPPRTSYSNHYDHVPEEGNAKNIIGKQIETMDRIQLSTKLDPDLIVGRSPRRVLQSVNTDNEVIKMKVDRLHQALGIDGDDEGDEDDDEGHDSPHESPYYGMMSRQNTTTSSFFDVSSNSLHESSPMEVISPVITRPTFNNMHHSLPPTSRILWGSNTDTNAASFTTQSEPTTSTTMNQHPTHKIDTNRSLDLLASQKEGGLKHQDQRCSSSSRSNCSVQNDDFKKEKQESQQTIHSSGQDLKDQYPRLQSILKSSSAHSSSHSPSHSPSVPSSVEEKRPEVHSNSIIATHATVDILSNAASKTINFSIPKVESNADSSHSTRSTSTFLSRSHPVIDHLQQLQQSEEKHHTLQPSPSSTSQPLSSTLTTPVSSCHIQVLEEEKEALVSRDLSHHQRSEVVTASGGSHFSAMSTSAISQLSMVESILDKRLLTVEEKCDRIMQLLESRLHASPPLNRSSPALLDTTRDVPVQPSFPASRNSAISTSPLVTKHCEEKPMSLLEVANFQIQAPQLTRSEDVNNTFATTITTVASTPFQSAQLRTHQSSAPQHPGHHELEDIISPSRRIPILVDEGCQTWEDKPCTGAGITEDNRNVMTTNELDGAHGNVFVDMNKSRNDNSETKDKSPGISRQKSESAATHRYSLTNSQQKALEKISKIKQELLDSDEDDGQKQELSDRRHHHHHHHQEKKDRKNKRKSQSSSSLVQMNVKGVEASDATMAMPQEPDHSMNTIPELRTRRTERLLEEILADLRAKAKLSVMHSDRSNVSPLRQHPVSGLSLSSRSSAIERSSAVPQLADADITHLVKELQQKVLLRTMKEAQLRILEKTLHHSK